METRKTKSEKFIANTVQEAIKQMTEWMPAKRRLHWFSISCKPGEGCVVYVHIR